MKSLEDSNFFIDGITETTKNEAKHQKKKEFLSAFLASLVASLVLSVISSVVKGISWRGVGRVGRRNMKNFFSSSLSFNQYRDY